MNSNWRSAMWRGLAIAFAVFAAALLLLHAISAAAAATPPELTALPESKPGNAVMGEPGWHLFVDKRLAGGWGSFFAVDERISTIAFDRGDRRWV